MRVGQECSTWALPLPHLTSHVEDASRTISPLGGAAYDAIEAEFARLKIPRRWIETQAPTRVCTTLLDEATHTTTELVENARPLTIDELAQAFSQCVSPMDSWLAWQIGLCLPDRCLLGRPPSFYLSRSARSDDGPSGSAPYRACGAMSCFAGGLERRPFLVKPNREELARTAGHPLADRRRCVVALGDA